MNPRLLTFDGTGGDNVYAWGGPPPGGGLRRIITLCITNRLEKHEENLARPLWHQGFKSFPQQPSSPWNREGPLIVRRIISKIERLKEGTAEERRRSKERLGALPDSPCILVVCHGNICRSPAGEILLRKRLSPNRFTISSAGLSHQEKLRTPSDFVQEASAFGLDLSKHRSRSISSLLVEWADLILIMDRSNLNLLFDFGRTGIEKSAWFGAWDPSGPLEIPDPYGATTSVMHKVLERLAKASEALAKDLSERG